MQTRSNKKEALRNDIISAAGIYSRELSGKMFMYVIKDDYFEVLFRNDCFKHLTGVASSISAKDFFKKAYKGKLARNQFYFDSQHPYNTACKKVSCLKRLPELTTDFVCVIKNMSTLTFVYTIGVTNLEFTLGLTEPKDGNGNIIENYYLPRTLRVNDHSIDRSQNPDDDIVDFIFQKSATEDKYSNLLVADAGVSVPKSISHLIDEKFYKDGD